ncbi:MAG: type III-B CRISPR module-associated protein Cmr5 [Campylobacterales bacterium]
MANKTIDQLRAAHALKHIKNLQCDRSKVVSYASSLPTMLLTNGLGQTVAFCMGKSEQEYKELIRMLDDWLRSPGRPYAGSKSLLDAITEHDMKRYMLAQTEALAYLTWVKKLAKALEEV